MVTATPTPAQPENAPNPDMLLYYWQQIAQAFPCGSNKVTDDALHDLYFEIERLKDQQRERLANQNRGE